MSILDGSCRAHLIARVGALQIQIPKLIIKVIWELMLAFLGKVLFLSSIVFSAYTLFSHNETINKFNSNLPGALKQCQCLPPATIKLITDNILYVRYAVVGLLGLAGLLIVSSSRFLTFLVLVGTQFLLCRAKPRYLCASEPTLW